MTGRISQLTLRSRVHSLSHKSGEYRLYLPWILAGTLQTALLFAVISPAAAQVPSQPTRCLDLIAGNTGCPSDIDAEYGKVNDCYQKLIVDKQIPDQTKFNVAGQLQDYLDSLVDEKKCCLVRSPTSLATSSQEPANEVCQEEQIASKLPAEIEKERDKVQALFSPISKIQFDRWRCNCETFAIWTQLISHEKKRKGVYEVSLFFKIKVMDPEDKDKDVEVDSGHAANIIYLGNKEGNDYYGIFEPKLGKFTAYWGQKDTEKNPRIPESTLNEYLGKMVYGQTDKPVPIIKKTAEYVIGPEGEASMGWQNTMNSCGWEMLNELCDKCPDMPEYCKNALKPLKGKIPDKPKELEKFPKLILLSGNAEYDRIQGRDINYIVITRPCPEPKK